MPAKPDGTPLPFGPTFEKMEKFLTLKKKKKKKKIAKPYKTSDPISNKFLMGILYPISDSTRQVRMIYYTLYQREWKNLKNTLTPRADRPFHPLSASGAW